MHAYQVDSLIEGEAGGSVGSRLSTSLSAFAFAADSSSKDLIGVSDVLSDLLLSASKYKIDGEAALLLSRPAFNASGKAASNTVPFRC